MLETFASTFMNFHKKSLLSSLHGTKPQFLFMMTSGFQLLLRPNLPQWPLLPFHSDKTQLLFLTPHTFESSATWGNLTRYQVCLPVWGTTLTISGLVLLYVDCRKHFPEDFLPWWCWSFRNHHEFLNSSRPASICSTKSKLWLKWFSSLLVTNNSSTPAKQIHRFLAQNMQQPW